MKRGASRAKIALASILGCVLTLQLGAFSVTIESFRSRRAFIIVDLPAFGLPTIETKPLFIILMRLLRRRMVEAL